MIKEEYKMTTENTPLDKLKAYSNTIENMTLYMLEESAIMFQAEDKGKTTTILKTLTNIGAYVVTIHEYNERIKAQLGIIEDLK